MDNSYEKEVSSMKTPQWLLRLAGKLLAVVALFAFLTAGTAAAQVCYVDTGGDDGQTGATPATAKETIEGCLAVAADGDVISIEAGTYDEGGDDVEVDTDVTFEARQTGGAFTRVIVDNGMLVTADVTFRANSDGSFDDGVFSLGDNALGSALIVEDGGSVTIEDDVAEGRVQIPDGGTVVRDNNAEVTGAITYLGTANVAYSDSAPTDLDIEAGGELPTDLEGGSLNVDLGDNSLTLTSVTGVDDLDVALNTVLIGTIAIDDDIDIAGPGNVGSLDISDGSVVFSAPAGVEDVAIANNAGISFDINGQTIDVTGDFERLGGSFDGGGATVNIVGDDEDATFSPGPNFEVATVTMDKDGGTVNLTEDITVTASGAAAFSVAEGTILSSSGDQVNVDANGIVDVDGTVTDVSTIVFRALGAVLEGDGTYGDILVTTSPVGDLVINVAEEIQFTGTLTLSSGGIASAGDISPSGDNAAVVVNLSDANQAISGSFNALANDYDLEYTGDIGGGGIAVNQEFDTPAIRDLTFNTSNGTVDATAADDGTISGSVTLNAAEDAYTVNLPADVTIAGILTVEDGATLDSDTGAGAITLQGSSNTVVGAIAAGVVTTLEGDLVGSDNEDHAASVGDVVADGDIMITNIQVIDGDLSSAADATLNLTMAEEMNVTGAVTLEGDGFTAESDLDIDGPVAVNAGSFEIGANDVTLGAGLEGAEAVTYSSDGGTLIFDGAGNFGTTGETVENVMIDGVALVLTSDVVVSNSLEEEGASSIAGAFDVELTGTFTSDGGAVFDVTTLTLNELTATLDDNLDVQGSNLVVAEGAGVDVVAADAETGPWTVDVGGGVALNGTLNLGDNDLDITGGDLVVDGGAVDMADGFVIVSGAADVLTGGAFSVANLRIAAATSIDEGALSVTERLELSDALTEDGDDDDLVLGDSVTIVVNAATPLADVPTFEGSVNLIYNAITDSGEEVPDAGEGMIADMDVSAAVELQKDAEVHGTLVLGDVLNTEVNDVDLLIADGATLRLEDNNGTVLNPATTVVEAEDNYTLVYAGGADEITDAEFLPGATVTTLVVDAGDGEVLDLDAAREVNNLTLSDGLLDLNTFGLTVEGDMTVEEDWDNIASTGGALVFGGAEDASIMLGENDLVVDSWDFRVAKENGGVVTAMGSSGSVIDFRTNGEILYLDSGVIDTDENVLLELDRTENALGVERDENEIAHIAGGINVEANSGMGGVEAFPIFQFPVGSPDGEYRPATLVFRDDIIADTEIIVNHEDVRPGGTNGLPLDGANDIQIGNYPDFYWLIESTQNLGSGQTFDLELTGTEIGLPFQSVDDLRIIRRVDGDADVNQWRLQGDGSAYDNFIVVEEGDSLVTVRVENSAGGLIPAGSRYTLGIPTRIPAISILNDDGEVVDSTSFEIAEGDTLDLEIRAHSLDQGQDVSLTSEDLPAFAELEDASGEDSTSSTLSLTPGMDDEGEYQITIVATDEDGSSELTIDLVVIDGAVAMLGDLNGDGGITPGDASLILSAVVGDTTLTEAQEVTADVSGNGSVGAFDAGLVLQCIVQNGGLPVEDASTCNFPAENSGKAGFVASGDLGWGDARSTEGGGISIPLRVSGNVANVYSIEFSGEMDMSRVDLRSVEGQLPDGWVLAWSADRETGSLHVAAVGGTPIADAGTVAELRFDLQEGSADVNIQGEARVNDNAPAPLGSMAVKEVPTEFGLGENYPNPFNPTTTFEYSVPEAARVTIEVWDVSGRLVQTLVDAEMEAGRYEVRWDGRSNAGAPVASGLYMYRMKAGSFIRAKTMMLVK
jgi:hypothetical protein